MRLLFTLPAVGLLAGCLNTGLSDQQESDLVDLCLILEEVTGQYWADHSVPTSSDPELNTPSVRPITQLGGTQGGADKINACIERQIVAGTTAFLP